MKKLIGIMLAIATVFCSFGVHTIADETTKDVQSEQLQAVRDYWNAVDYGDWAGWVECFAPSIREGHMQIAAELLRKYGQSVNDICKYFDICIFGGAKPLHFSKHLAIIVIGAGNEARSQLLKKSQLILTERF